METAPAPITFIIPARNSFPAIATCLNRLLEESEGRDVKIVVVVNTSMPGPCAVDVRQYHLLQDGRVDLMELPRKDKAAAISWAVHNIEGRTIGYVDADFGWEAPAGVFVEALGLVDGGADMVYGVRDMVDWSRLRRCKTLFFALLVRLLLRLQVRDSQAPAKFLSPDYVRTIRPHLRLRGWEFDVELLWFADRLGFRLVPFRLRLLGGGGEKWWASLLLILLMGSKMVANLLRLWLWTIFRGRSVLSAIRVQRHGMAA